MTNPITSSQVAPQTLERERLDIEMAKAEFEMNNALVDSEIQKLRLEIERDRLALDRSKVQFDQRFWHRNIGTVITAVISLAAVIVSTSQVWSAYIIRNKEIEISNNQKQIELTKLEEQKIRELELNWARFVMDNRRSIFSPDPREREMIAKLIPAVFSIDISPSLFTRLEVASPPPAKKTWRDARKAIAQAPVTESDEVEKSQPEQEPPPMGIPLDVVFIRNFSGRQISFLLRNSDSNWRWYNLGAGNYANYKNMDRMQIFTANGKTVYHKLELGKGYEFYWDSSRETLDIRDVIR